MTTKRKSAKKRATSTTTKSNNTETTTMSACETVRITIRAGVLIALAIFLLTGAWGIREYIHTTQESAEMSFTGIGKHSIPNDTNTAKITFSFSNVHQDVSIAQEEVIKQVENAYEALKYVDIPDADIQTVSYTIRPEYKRPTEPTAPFTTSRPTDLIGYRVSHTTTVTIKEIGNVGSVLATLTDRNPETLTSPLFSADEEHKSYAKDIATIKAIHDAKIRAYKIARLSNLRLKKITRINVYENNPRPSYARLESAQFNEGPQAKEVPIQQGEQRIQQTAVITYEVEEQKRRWRK